MSTKYIVNNGQDQTIGDWGFGATGLTFPDDTIQTTAYTGGVTGPTGPTGPTGETGPTGSVVIPYKVYAALLTQSVTGAPVPTVLENTIGNIVWTRDGIGYYIATLSAAFTTDKTVVLFGNPAYTIPPIDIIVNLGSINSIDINTIISGVFADNSFAKTFIEIRVYN